MTPLMLIVFRFPPHVAVGTSMTIVRFIWDSYEDRINR